MADVNKKEEVEHLQEPFSILVITQLPRAIEVIHRLLGMPAGTPSAPIQTPKDLNTYVASILTDIPTASVLETIDVGSRFNTVHSHHDILQFKLDLQLGQAELSVEMYLENIHSSCVINSTINGEAVMCIVMGFRHTWDGALYKLSHKALVKAQQHESFALLLIEAVDMLTDLFPDDDHTAQGLLYSWGETINHAQNNPTTTADLIHAIPVQADIEFAPNTEPNLDKRLLVDFGNVLPN